MGPTRTSTEPLQNIAQQMRKPPLSKKFVSSTYRILKQLNQTRFQGRIDPLMEIIDTKAAKIRSELPKINTYNLTTLVEKTNRLKAAGGTGDPFLEEKTQTILSEKEKLEKEVDTYIKEMQSYLLKVSNEKKQGKSNSEIPKALELSKQVDNLSKRVNDLKVNVETYQKDLVKLNQKMYTHLSDKGKKAIEEGIRKEMEEGIIRRER